MKQLFFFILICFPFVLYAQGIKWTEDLSWGDVKALAKQKGKYIFIDAYATWCAPCKKMDRDVYSNDTIGNFFNSHFISVKLQMDKTKNDDPFIKSWYNDAETIGKQYRVLSYPFFIFFNPGGDVVHIESGYKSIQEMLNLAQMSIEPGRVYNSPYAEYDKLIAEYKQGIKNYHKMPFMIITAIKLKDDELKKRLLEDHTEHVLGLSKKERYTKENIAMWSDFLIGSHKARFKFFYEDGTLINKVMGKKGYAEQVVDRTITHEIVNPFFKRQNSGIDISASAMIVTDPKAKSLYLDPNWDELYAEIKTKFNKSCADRNLVEAKLTWYERHKNWPAYTKQYLIKLDKYSYQFNFKEKNITAVLNALGWRTFLGTIDKDTLMLAAKWVSKALKSNPSDFNTMDTYAQLLYKAGNRNIAIEWQEKVIMGYTMRMVRNSTPSIKRELEVVTLNLEDMKSNRPTYLSDPEQPNWDGVHWLKQNKLK